MYVTKDAAVVVSAVVVSAAVVGAAVVVVAVVVVVVDTADAVVDADADADADAGAGAGVVATPPDTCSQHVANVLTPSQQ